MLVFAIIFSILFLSMQEPKRCSICAELKRHAPCLLNLNTGKLGELDLYEPHPYKVGEIAEVQDSSYFAYFYAAGLQGIKVTNPWEISIEVPEKRVIHLNHSFCRKCRKLLSEYKSGYVLIDLYEPTNPVIYPIFSDAAYQIRCYTISVAYSKENKVFDLSIKGTLDTSEAAYSQ